MFVNFFSTFLSLSLTNFEKEELCKIQFNQKSSIPLGFPSSLFEVEFLTSHVLFVSSYVGSISPVTVFNL